MAKRTGNAGRRQLELSAAASDRAAQAIVDTGVCPRCGTGLVRNTAMSGWWQCGGYPQCSFQTFTE